MGGGSHGAHVFAVEDTSVQVVFAHLPAGDWQVEAGGQIARLHQARRGPAAATVHGLPAATRIDVTLSGPGVPRTPVARARTLEPPPGRLLSRLATMSDIHLGSYAFGLRNTITEDPEPGWHPFPWRCAHAALTEAVAWGAEMLVVKGDLTATGRRSQLNDVGQLFSAAPVPVHLMLGNHEITRRGTDPWAVLAAWGLDTLRDVRVIDQPGIRVVLAHTPAPISGRGHLTAPVKAKVLEAAAGAPGGVLLLLHHYLQAWPLPTFYPISIPSPVANPFLAALGRSHPDTLISSGHSHRNRRYERRGLTLTEVASTIHYPGVWAGYAIYEGGIRQVVRRIVEPSATEWVERTRRAVGGFWGRWAAGRLSDRCFSLLWAHPAPAAPPAPGPD
ncbi:MAG TPA: metallophosphoesterase [Acidimicrobiales bacterium]